MLKKSAHATKTALAIGDHRPLLGLQFVPSHVQRNASLARETLEFGEKRTILWLRPRLDGAFVQGLALIGDHEVEVEIDRVPETLTARTSSIRIVKRKQPWL